MDSFHGTASKRPDTETIRRRFLFKPTTPITLSRNVGYGLSNTRPPKHISYYPFHADNANMGRVQFSKQPVMKNRRNYNSVPKMNNIIVNVK